MQRNVGYSECRICKEIRCTVLNACSLEPSDQSWTLAVCLWQLMLCMSNAEAPIRSVQDCHHGARGHSSKAYPGVQDPRGMAGLREAF